MKVLAKYSLASNNTNRGAFGNLLSSSSNMRDGRGGSLNINAFKLSSQPDIVVEPVSVADDELNDRYQKFMLREENGSLEQR